jgi:hypothetical protein
MVSLPHRGEPSRTTQRRVAGATDPNWQLLRWFRIDVHIGK